MSVVSNQYERSRLAALDRYAVLDTKPEAIFDQFAAMSAQLLEAPISIVGMIDQDRHWFKAAHGTNTRSNSRQDSFCTYTVQSDRVFTVEDASKDVRFANNPVVAGETHIRAYAGAPLVTRDGLSIGTLCVFDTSPRHFSDHECNRLTRLAAIVMQELEDRLERLHNTGPESREAALDRASANIGERLGLSVLKLFGSQDRAAQDHLELDRFGLEALNQDSDALEELFTSLRQNLSELQPNPNLKLKLLERLRFTRNHNPKPAPARALILNAEHAIVAHAFNPNLELQVWSKQPGSPALALNAFNGSAVKVQIPSGSILIGLSAFTDSSEPDWLALGELPFGELQIR